MRSPAALTFALALASGCTCRGKGSDAAGGAAEQVVGEVGVGDAEPAKVESAKEEPAKEEPAYEKGRFDIERVGFVKATLGDRRTEFAILPSKQNRVSFGTKPPLVLVDGYGSEGAKEHLRVHIQGVPVDKWKGRPLVRGKDRSWLVAITYQDAQGKTYAGRLDRDDRVAIAIDEVDPTRQLVTGTFSGPLREADGEGVIEVTDGSFRTVRRD